MGANDIVKGYQYDKDHYVIVTDDEMERIKTEKEKSIQILHFAQLNQISPIYYDRAFHVVPEAGGDKAFELLRKALMEEQKVAIGKTVLGSHETLMAIIPREDGVLIATMHFEDEIKDIPKAYHKPEVSEQELSMAKALIHAMDTPFDPAAYHDEYQGKLRQLIEDKITGKEIVSASSEGQNNVIDLMDALKASIEQNKPDKPRRGRKKQGA
jgi:DNA end-binding protein Ku